MQHAVLVRILEGRGNLIDETGGLFERKASAFEQVVAQGATIDIRHDQVVPGALLAEIVKCKNVIMRKSTNGQRFTLEATHESFISSVEYFDGNLAANTAIIG